ncbi:hypothetical protein D2V17_08295 [Aurantiacibacter xanthus]|uniref:TonB C-terminal domain-containing protein n=1 Tax=Aurantiacibacter xanthus TaxID=1784712 RepID=A0A3A1P4L2_9SPHN|nr:energy transducer TonB [Aurantiacibacter xanthus]RIV87385.1 hypothetical protein D2V17_08295 [Aurantiacibacter xanthus]
MRKIAGYCAGPALVVGTLLATPLQARDEVPSDPVPVGDRSTWVTSEDWPPDLYQHETGGIVRAELAIDADGQVKNCRIVETSGYAPMDEVVCVRLTQRGKFKPARDVNGRPVNGLHRTSVVFGFDDSLPSVPEPGSVTMEVTLGADGTVSDCALVGTMPAAVTQPRCPAGVAFEPVRDAEGNAVRAVIRTTITVEHQILQD